MQFTASAETYDKLRRVQDLLRPQIPDGDPAAVFERALTVLLEQLEKTKFAKTERPRVPRPSDPLSRRIPAALRRLVWERDGGQCAFVGRDGRRCTERSRLHFHHIVPYPLGGKATAENVSIRCAAHNGYEADLAFGPGTSLIRRRIRRSGGDPSQAPGAPAGSSSPRPRTRGSD